MSETFKVKWKGQTYNLKSMHCDKGYAFLCPENTGYKTAFRVGLEEMELIINKKKK